MISWESSKLARVAISPYTARQPHVLTGRRSGQVRSSTFSLTSVLPSISSPEASVLIESASHGYQCMNFPRPLLIQTLLEGLGASSAKIRTGAGIDNIETTEKGVRVHLSDGRVEEGSIVIGADGVHSKTRDISTRLIPLLSRHSQPLRSRVSHLSSDY